MKNESEKPNIIFITIDGLRSRNLGCYGYSRNTSPNIDSLAKQGVLFENFFSSHNNSHKSFLSILGSRHVIAQDFCHYPSKNEMKSFFDTGGVLLSEILQKQGYKTHFLMKLFGWQKIGFDYYFKQDAQEKSKKWNLIRFIKKIPAMYNISKYALHNFYFIPKKLENKIRSNSSGKVATDKAIEIIKQNKKNNFFLWLHYTDTHVPHIFPHSLRNKFSAKREGKKIFEVLNSKNRSIKDIDFLKNCWKSKDTIDDIIAKYDTSIFYDDYLIGRIIQTLKEENLFENTIVFIFADHGESLDEHGLYFTHCGLYDNTFHIPLIIIGNGIPKNKRIDSLAQLEDITPTILDLIGIKHDSLLFDGKSLLPSIFDKEKENRKSIFIEEHNCSVNRRGVRTKNYKYVESPEKEHSVCRLCNTTHGETTSLFDLKKDPHENTNIAEKNKKILIEMKFELDKIIKERNTLNEKRRIKTVISKKWQIK
jgi:arylsulfatase A-like enzyme